MRSLKVLLLPILGALLVRAAPSPCEGDSEIDCSGFTVDEEPLKRSLSPSPVLHKRAPPTQVPSYKTWLPAQGGCWQDHNSDRALDHFLGHSDSQTVESCLDACEAQGFFLGAVEFGNECSCGNTIMDRNRPTSASSCSMPCAGDATEQCGGAGAMNLYVRDNYQFTVGPASLLSSYHGFENPLCWVDSVSNRVLKGRPATSIPLDLMTVQKCIDGCAAAGYNAAGLEFGRECFCDNLQTPPSLPANINDCNMPCLGDGSTFCGGPDRVLIYTNNPLQNYRGIIQVKRADNGEVLGYISKNTLSSAQYRIQPTENQAVHVTFQLPVGATSGSRLDVKTQDSDIPNFVYLGLVQGRDNTNSVLMPGSFHYAYFAGSNQTPAGSTPLTVGNSYSSATGLSRTSESAVWTINLITGQASVNWINPDGSIPTVTTFLQSTALYISGDAAAFFSRYPATITPVTLKFLPRP